MKVVYSCSTDLKGKVESILQKDTTEKISFARQGYDFKDGKTYGVEGWIIYLEADEDFIKWAEEQFGDLVKKLAEDKTNEIALSIKQEKDRASEGFGNLFG
ncbi:hypothetical protein KO465_01685 [Candidatus Micrarchaeota archaeon]|nr:hypothetical protein [Candidatus Micrarchaeota archaeon]